MNTMRTFFTSSLLVDFTVSVVAQDQPPAVSGKFMHRVAKR